MSTEDSTRPSEGTADPAALFPIAAPPAPESSPVVPPRLRRADRRQVVKRPASLDSLLPDGHRARVAWEFAQGVDLSPLYADTRSVDRRTGRDATDPQILLALWLHATLEGVGSARQLARLCEEHVAYQWICGGMSMNHHSLSDFRAAHPEFMAAC
jgi:transposase